MAKASYPQSQASSSSSRVDEELQPYRATFSLSDIATMRHTKTAPGLLNVPHGGDGGSGSDSRSSSPRNGPGGNPTRSPCASVQTSSLNTNGVFTPKNSTNTSSAQQERSTNTNKSAPAQPKTTAQLLEQLKRKRQLSSLTQSSVAERIMRNEMPKEPQLLVGASSASSTAAKPSLKRGRGRPSRADVLARQEAFLIQLATEHAGKGGSNVLGSGANNALGKDAQVVRPTNRSGFHPRQSLAPSSASSIQLDSLASTSGIIIGPMSPTIATAPNQIGPSMSKLSRGSGMADNGENGTEPASSQIVDGHASITSGRPMCKCASMYALPNGPDMDEVDLDAPTPIEREQSDFTETSTSSAAEATSSPSRVNGNLSLRYII